MENAKEMMHGPAEVIAELAARAGLGDRAAGDERSRKHAFSVPPDLDSSERLALADGERDGRRRDDPLDDGPAAPHDLQLRLSHDERELRTSVRNVRPRIRPRPHEPRRAVLRL